MTHYTRNNMGNNLKRIELPLSEKEIEAIDSFVDDVRNANFSAITEECSIGDAIAIIANKALKLAKQLEFGD